MSWRHPRGDTALKVIVGAVLLVLMGFCAQPPAHGPGVERPLPD